MRKSGLRVYGSYHVPPLVMAFVRRYKVLDGCVTVKAIIPVFSRLLVYERGGGTEDRVVGRSAAFVPHD